MAAKFRVGIVGPVSAFTLYFAEALVEAPDVEFGGLAHLGRSAKYIRDAWNLPYLRTYPQSLEAYVEAYGGRLYEQTEELIEAERLDAVCITTEDYLRPYHALRALEQGCHVFIPKPFASSVAEGQQMLTAAKDKGLVLMGSLPLRFNPLYVCASELIDQGAIGEPLSGHFSIIHHLTLGGWKSDPSMAAGPEYEMGFYTFDAMRMLMKDEPRTVVAMADNLDHRGIPYIDSATCLVRFSGGALVSADLRFCMHHRFGDHAGAEVIGNAGSLTFEADPETGRQIVAVYSRAGVERHPVEEARGYKGDEMLHWARLCMSGGDPTPWHEEAMGTLRFIDAFVEAHRSGMPVDIPETPVEGEVAAPEMSVRA